MKDEQNKFKDLFLNTKRIVDDLERNIFTLLGAIENVNVKDKHKALTIKNSLELCNKNLKDLKPFIIKLDPINRIGYSPDEKMEIIEINNEALKIQNVYITLSKEWGVIVTDKIDLEEKK